MLIATIIAAAFSTNNVEASLLSSPKVEILDCKQRQCPEMVALAECLNQIEEVLLGFRTYYYEICNGGELSPDQYTKLVSLESIWKGRSELSKAFWQEHSEQIKLSAGAEAYDLLRKSVVANVQLHRVIENVTSFYAEQLGFTEIVNETHFHPTAEFWQAATDASNQVYGRH
ncbi:hypothetical protein [Shewanella xiamenensis]|uniref:Uncharacterized protein n=1 Tax=Shewanella xiamenensis TaxID=332186 RepID=A0ABT6UBN9_9GAMM|nr:hypothetical protein [Shewanella xiamenensis]MDI5830714.1 hypothetical protein [Shewanella xiamenensis]